METKLLKFNSNESVVNMFLAFLIRTVSHVHRTTGADGENKTVLSQVTTLH